MCYFGAMCDAWFAKVTAGGITTIALASRKDFSEVTKLPTSGKATRE
jgi:hypothetical protein